MAKTFVGSRVRQLRNERGFSQAALAQILEISPSYLNQIEHDVRPLTVAVLLRITEVFGVDATFFASNDDTRLVAELREVLLDRDLDVRVEMSEIVEAVNTHPELARAMVNLHRRHRITTTQLAAATEERYADGSGTITMPHEEVRDFFYQRQNYLHDLDTAAEDLATQMRRHQGELAVELATRLTDRHGVHINRRIDLGETVLHRYDARNRTLDISNHLSWGQRVFKMAAELAYLEFDELISGMVDEGKFTSKDSRTLARLGLANYFAAALVLPYRQFHDSAETFRYDIERLSAFYRVSYETVAHRLSTLQRPRCAGCRSRSSASTAPETCQNDSRPLVFTSPPAVEPALCGMSTRRFRTRARSWYRSRRCLTGATTCGWRVRWSAARPVTGNPARCSPSASVVNCAKHIGWSTPTA